MPFYNKLNENIVVNNVFLPRLPIKLLSPVQLFVIPRTVAYQAPPSMEFSRKEYWSGLPFLSPSPEDLPTQGSNPGLLHCRQTLYYLSYQGSPAFTERGKILLKAWILESGRNLPILCSATVAVWPWTFYLKFFNTQFPILWNGHNYSVHLVVLEDNAGEVCSPQ